MLLEIVLVCLLVNIFFFIVICNCLRKLFTSHSNNNNNLHRDSFDSVTSTRERLRQQENNVHNEHDTSQNEGLTCPICLNQTHFTIETNCAHKFCANCIVQYWNTLTNHRRNIKLKCPLCRQMVNCLFTSFTQNEQHSDDYSQIMRQINEYNRQFANEPQNLVNRLRDLPTLMRYLFSDTFARNGLSLFNKIRVYLLTVMNVLYLVSPIDVLPEAVFGIIGYFDDMVFVFTTLMYLSTVYRDIIANRANLNS